MTTAYINSQNKSCLTGGIEYALVLGTNVLTDVGVQVPRGAPEITTGKNSYPSSKLHGIGSCTRCCILEKKLQCEEGEVAGLLGNTLSVSLRNACHISNIFTTAYKSIHTNIL